MYISYMYKLFRPNITYGFLKNHQKGIIKSRLKVKKHLKIRVDIMSYVLYLVKNNYHL